MVVGTLKISLDQLKVEIKLEVSPCVECATTPWCVYQDTFSLLGKICLNQRN